MSASDTDTPDSITIEWTDATGTRRRMVFEAKPNRDVWERTERVETEDGHWRTTGSEPVSQVRVAVGDETLDDSALSTRQIQCVHSWKRVDQDGVYSRWSVATVGSGPRHRGAIARDRRDARRAVSVVRRARRRR